MLIVFEWGRLGNQLFQYAAMRVADPQGAIWAVGMPDIRQLFVCHRFYEWGDIRSTKRLVRFCIRRLIEMVRCGLALLASTRIIGLIAENTGADNGGIAVRRGFLKQVYYVQLGFWQNQAVVDMASDVIPPMNPEFETKAASIVEEIGVSKRDLYFVHIRRGDYDAWPSKEHPAIVPLRWYEQQISRIRELNPDAFFLVFSDDFWYVHDFFSGKDWARVCGEGHYIDFMLMAQCHGGGVLSASSYAWWAAYYARRENSEAYFVAPLYWAGHRLGKWYPECIETEWINYQPVS